MRAHSNLWPRNANGSIVATVRTDENSRSSVCGHGSGRARGAGEFRALVPFFDALALNLRPDSPQRVRAISGDHLQRGVCLN
jgi:hypothetical protein